MNRLSCLRYFSIELFGRHKGGVCLQYVWVLKAQGYQEPASLFACVCMCACSLCTHKRNTHSGTGCSLLADGFFSLEPKAQPSANISTRLAKMNRSHTTEHTHNHVFLRLLFFISPSLQLSSSSSSSLFLPSRFTLLSFTCSK